MGLCKTSNCSIFTFINANDLTFCTRSYSSCVFRITRFKWKSLYNDDVTPELYCNFLFTLEIGLLQQGSCDLPTLKCSTWDFVNTRDGKSRKKISRTAKFEVCSTEIESLVAV